jgi:thymidylate synthase ThyX
MAVTHNDHFSFSSTNTDETGLRIISLEDARTGFVVRTALTNDGIQVPAIMAFAGARFSRSADSATDIFKEIHDSKKSAQEKLANIFHNYGHASVGDMAMLFAYIENVPRYLMCKFFSSSALGGGQERSSRYQDFSSSVPLRPSLYFPTKALQEKHAKLIEKQQRYFLHLLSLYKKYTPIIEEAYTKVYKPDPAIKGHKSALQARIFDTTRAFLPAGTATSGSYITSAREWARLITEFKGSPFYDLQCLGEQLELLFAPPEDVAAELKYQPEAPDLIRHTEPDTRLQEVMTKLKPLARHLAVQISGRGKYPQQRMQKVRHLADRLNPGSAYLFLTLLLMYPMLTVGKFTVWYNTLSDYTKKKISRILFREFTHHHQVPLFGRTGGYMFEAKLALSEMIDFNRHRAWGRFSPFLETTDSTTLVRDGYQLPLYLDHPELAEIKTSFIAEFDRYYEKLLAFSQTLPEDIDPRFILSLLPNAHSVRFYMSGGPRELSYFPQLRVRPGGHINYRALAYEIAQQTAKIDPILHGARLQTSSKPNPFSREEFFDRS